MLATIGYEKASLEDFVETLVHCRIDVLIDIRDRAQSRRPGFSKTTLAAALEFAGIKYIHYRQLGDPKEGREAARSGKMEDFRKIFGATMSTPDAQEALLEIEAWARSSSVCLMCFERDKEHCHRKIVSDHLEGVLGLKATHLGVRTGIANVRADRRMLHFNQGATTPIQQVF